MTADQLEKVRLKLDEFMAESVSQVKAKGKYTDGEVTMSQDLRSSILNIHEAVVNVSNKGAGDDAILGALMGYMLVFSAAKKGKL